MSYARWGAHSDVYVYYDGGSYVCCRCILHDTVASECDHYCSSPANMLEHLEKHLSLAHKVPGEAMERLRGDKEHGGYREP